MVINFQVAIKDTIGDRVRTVRAARNWSQGTLAIIAKTNQMSVSRLENNISIDKDEQTKILKALDIE